MTLAIAMLGSWALGILTGATAMQFLRLRDIERQRQIRQRTLPEHIAAALRDPAEYTNRLN